MHRKILTIAVAVFALALAASPALAAKSPHRYSPKHGAKCRKTYKRVKHGRKVYCVKRAPRRLPGKKAGTPTPPAAPNATAPTTEKVKLHAHLDPTFTRNPLNPFEVTYAYSASAGQQSLSAQSEALGAEEPAPLPSGVLALYSDGRLECAINVGSGVEGSECPVEYAKLGQHIVTTIYTSGEESATETETEVIEPLATETTLAVSYAAHEPEPEKVSGGLWWIGDLTISPTAAPNGNDAVLGCEEGPPDQLTASGCYQVAGNLQHVYANPTGSCAAPELGSIYIAEVPSTSGASFSAQALEAGIYHLRAAVAGGDGYGPSEATSPIQFTPEVTFAPDC